jgi:deoxyribonuclease-4
VGVCFDTCHAFAAGYDLGSEAGYEKTFRVFDEVIGLEHLRAFHLNDCKKPLGCRVDRHEHIGEGSLGREPFRRLVNDPRFAALPGFLETEMRFRENLDVLRSLRR